MAVPLTKLSAVEYDHILYGQMTPAMAVRYLREGRIPLRSFAETLRGMYPAPDLAERLEDCGISALTIHGRTRAQMYTGEADWEPIAAVRRNPRIKIPIIGNGDITSAEQAEQAFSRYGVDAVMVGRATFGRPWVFKEMRDRLDLGPGAGTPLTTDEKVGVLLEQLRINVERIDEYRGILHTRRHLAATPLFKGIPDFRQTRIAMLRAETVSELTGLVLRAAAMAKAAEAARRQ